MPVLTLSRSLESASQQRDGRWVWVYHQHHLKVRSGWTGKAPIIGELAVPLPGPWLMRLIPRTCSFMGGGIYTKRTARF
jgi:hypothetical protein